MPDTFPPDSGIKKFYVDPKNDPTRKTGEAAKEKQRQEAEHEADMKAKGHREGVAVEGEETFHGRPLSYFDGMTDEQIKAEKGIGESTFHDIKAAQKRRDRKAGK